MDPSDASDPGLKPSHLAGSDECGHTNLTAGGPVTIDDLNTAAAVAIETDMTALNISTMLTAEARELSILMEIRSTLSKEEASIKRVKADGVREAINKITNLLNIVLTERSSLRKARRMLVEAVKTNGPSQRDVNILAVVTESLARQEAGIAAHSRQLEKMEGILTSQAKPVELTKPRGLADGNQEEWTDVVKRRPKSDGPVDQKKESSQAQKIARPRNPAILIRTDAKAFPALAKKLRGDSSIAPGKK
ncbi:unnamed protein product [Macrosiphum euphorbiae]|uniref:Uncharacterized protein n=1 Tax=Macrosiphum euphorbiae TaxID=13131 RepID=A0AAV0XUG3_9HEMI|nr:unnamed protein product [Macrosiphum euphorbiae]